MDSQVLAATCLEDGQCVPEISMFKKEKQKSVTDHCLPVQLAVHERYL
jgi:hypothetical protein